MFHAEQMELFMLNLPPDMRLKLKSRLLDEEGYRQFPYIDTTGHTTIGIGRNLSSAGISMNEALYLLDDDIMQCEKDLWASFPWYANLDDARKIVLIDMCFNMGIINLLKFINMINALKNKNYSLAAREMLNSKWATQVHARAKKLAIIMETGNL